MLLWSLLAPLVRWGVFAVLAVGVVWWGLNGLAWTRGKVEPTAARTAQQAISELALHDPAAAETARKILADKPLGLEVVTAASGPDAVSMLKRLADQEKSLGGRTPPLVELAQLAIQSRELPTDVDREAFLVAHTANLDALAAADSPALLKSYLDELDAAARDPERMRAAFDDPVALIVWSKVPDPELRRFYHAQRDWLGEILVEGTAQAEDSAASADAGAALAAVISAAQKYHPLPQKAVQELKLGWLGFQAFLVHGDLIAGCVKDGIPLDDALDVVFANTDFLAEKVKAQGVEKTARSLAELRLGRPQAWLAARHSAGALRLAEACPREAETLFAKYGADDLPALLLSSYPDQLVPAAKAVDELGDLAIYYLAKYRDDARFKKYLADPKVGSRLFPFLVLQGDAAFDKLDADPTTYSWLDKYIAADGKPIDPEWWTHLPGGGAVNVVRNVAQGRPNEWSELGWAALDVADATLVVMSFGATAPVSASKAGAGTAARTAGKALLRQEAAEAMVASAARTARGSRAAARTAFAEGKASSLLQRMARGGGAVLTYSLQSAGKFVGGAAARTLEAARVVRTAAAAVPAPVRMWVARGLLAASLAFRVQHQISPNVDQISTGLAGVVGGTVKGVSELFGTTLAKSAQNLLRDAFGASPGVASWAAFALVFLGFAAAAWFAWPGPKPFGRRVQYA